MQESHVDNCILTFDGYMSHWQLTADHRPPRNQH